MPAPTRTRHVRDRRDLEDKIEEYILDGYKVLSQSDRSAIVKKAYYGEVTWHIVWAVLTAGIGNAIYAILSNQKSEQVRLVVEGAD